MGVRDRNGAHVGDAQHGAPYRVRFILRARRIQRIVAERRADARASLGADGGALPGNPCGACRPGVALVDGAAVGATRRTQRLAAVGAAIVAVAVSELARGERAFSAVLDRLDTMRRCRRAGGGGTAGASGTGTTSIYQSRVHFDACGGTAPTRATVEREAREQPSRAAHGDTGCKGATKSTTGIVRGMAGSVLDSGTTDSMEHPSCVGGPHMPAAVTIPQISLVLNSVTSSRT